MDLVLFAGVFVSVILWIVHVEMFFHKLKQVSPHIFQELGSPSVLGRRSSGLPALRFIILREYRQLDDESFVRMGNRIVVHFIVTILIFFSFFYFIAQFRT
jgi:hypothetical protein